jgi:DNA-binding NtrC family response regulator
LVTGHFPISELFVMTAAPLPPEEPGRLRALRGLGILDTAPERGFDDIARIASYLMNTPIALVSLVDEDRQWFKARVGLEVSETPREHSFCAHAILDVGVTHVRDASRDKRFCDNPLVLGAPAIRFYAGAPLRTADGHAVGSLCVIDRKPRSLTDRERDILEALARQVMTEFELRRANALLRQRQEDLRLLFGALERAGIVALDGRRRVIFVDPTAERVFRIDNSTAAGLPWQEVLQLAPEHEDAIETLLRNPASPPAQIRLARTGVVLEMRRHAVPVDPESVLLLITDITELEQLRTLLGHATETHGLVGVSYPLRQIVEQIERVAPVDISVLISGETGSGKEVASRAVHALSPRAKGPFVAVNCAAFTESLLGSQLFGHRKGAFTGAVQDHVGLFESATGGTVFLDEIGDMPIALQSSLLRVLDTREVVRLGDSRTRPTDFRLVAATNRDLRQQIRDGSFREDLYYRIRGLEIRLPALRERREDIPLLVQHFARESAALFGADAPEFSDAAMARLLDYDWPGNVRELRSAVSFAFLHCRRRIVAVDDLPPEIRNLTRTTSTLLNLEKGDPRTQIISALARAGGNRARAARLLGLSRATLYRRLDRLGIDAD